ncbi:MAG: hypothetical protein AAF633_19920, partial [Chloroflexota bacterium]
KDGGFIVFHSNRPEEPGGDDSFDIYKIDVDGAVNSEVKLTDNGKSFSPSVSPDGSKIVYHSPTNGREQIFILDIETGEERQLTSGAGNFTFPVWSPNAENPKIAFHSDRDGVFDIFVINPDGSELVKITSDLEFDAFFPSWSPNGEFVLFHARVGDVNRDLYMAKVDGSGILRLTRTNGIQERQPSLQPVVEATE